MVARYSAPVSNYYPWLITEIFKIQAAFEHSSLYFVVMVGHVLQYYLRIGQDWVTVLGIISSTNSKTSLSSKNLQSSPQPLPSILQSLKYWIWKKIHTDMHNENYSTFTPMPFRNFPKTKVYIGIIHSWVFKLPARCLIAVTNLQLEFMITFRNAF